MNMYKSKKQLEQEIFESIDKDYISLSIVEDMQILSKNQVRKLIEKKQIKSMKFKNKTFIERKGLSDIIKNYNKE
jgi:hypothetical protein